MEERFAFYERAKKAYAIVATGEEKVYANIILKKASCADANSIEKEIIHMSGHSKWHNIQAKKGKADAARGRIFTKLGREIAVAAKGNPNPETNSKLADVIAKAKSKQHA